MKVFVLIKDLLSLMTIQQRRNLYFLQVLVVLSALIELISITAIGPFIALIGNIDLIDNNVVAKYLYTLLGGQDKYDFLMFIGGGIIFVLIMSAFLNILTIRKLSLYSASTGAEIADTLYSYYLNKDYLYHLNTNSSVLIKQIATEVGRVTDNVLQPLVQINARLISVILISAFLFIYNPMLSIVGFFVIFTCYFMLFYFVRDRLAQNGNAISEASKNRFRIMSESFSAIKEITVLGCQKTFVDEFYQSGRVFSRAYGSSNGLYNSPRYLIEVIVFSGMIIGLLLSISFGGNDFSGMLPALSIFAVATFKLLPSFQQIYSGAAQIRGNYSAFHFIKNDLYDARNNMKCEVFNTLDVSTESEVFGDIVLSDVKFRYPLKSVNALDGISMIIPEGSFIGIAGNSGSGKSTLFDLLLGVISADSGRISVGGIPLSKENICSWQKKIGYVSQSIFLRDGTLIENIAFGVPGNDIKLEKVNDVLAKAQLDLWVKSLDDGVYSQVGENGVQISGGQKQRIGIARALYHDADFLFFDEATSALDGVTEKEVMSAINGLNNKKTIVMIAHRLNTLKRCDCIYFFDNGLISDKGSYESLLNTNKRFEVMAIGANND